MTYECVAGTGIIFVTSYILLKLNRQQNVPELRLYLPGMVDQLWMLGCRWSLLGMCFVETRPERPKPKPLRISWLEYDSIVTVFGL